MSNELKARFERVYLENAWGDKETSSGWGSRRESPSVQQSIEALEMMFVKYGVKSIVDIPCGDFNWISPVLAKFPQVEYVGCDIVDQIIANNSKCFPDYSFHICDITELVPPRADMIFCKDLFNHLAFEDVMSSLRSIIDSGSHYLLASNNFGWNNTDLSENNGGASRHLDLCAVPYSLSRPIWSTTYLGLWDLGNIQSDSF